LAYRKIDPLDYVNDVEYNLKEFVEKELDGYYVFDIEDSYNAVKVEPYKPVYFFQMGDTNRTKRDVVVSDKGEKADIIVLQYVLFILLNDDYSDLKPRRELNKISNKLLDTVDKNKEDLLDPFNKFSISSQVDGTLETPNGFTVNKHFINIKIIREK